MPRARQAMLVVTALAAVASGCANWQAAAEPATPLSKSRLAPDAVVLEIAFVRLPEGVTAEQDEIWLHADEQSLPADLRRRLFDNGLRAGVVSSQLPAVLRRLLDERSANVSAQAAENPLADVTASQRQLQSLTGRRSVIQTGGLQEEMTLLLHQNGDVVGERFSQAQGLLAVRTYPRGDGRVRLNLVPEIEHGHPKQRFVPQEGSFQFDVRKEQRVIDSLNMDLVLAPGDVLVLTATAEQKGLGKQFFVESAGGQKVLLIRLAQTQYDDLFAPEALREPLVSAGDR